MLSRRKNEMSRFTRQLLIASILAGSAAAQVGSSQQQKKPTPTPTPRPATQTANQPKPQPATNTLTPPPQRAITPQKAQPTPTVQGSAPKATTAPPYQPITPTSHPQSTIAISPSAPQALPNSISHTNNGLPSNIPKTTIGPVSPAAQQSALLAQLKQALRVQQFRQDPMYYTIVCGPASVCPQPSFTPNQSIPSPNDGFGVEQYRYLTQVENGIDRQAQQIISQQGTAGAQSKINEIRRRYDPTYH